jgi:hypothetical protein
MKWLFVNPLARSPWDNADNSIQGLCRVLASRGDDCLVAAPPDSDWHAVCRQDNVHHAPLASGKGCSPQALWRIHRICRLYQPDIVVTRIPRMARYARLAWPSAAIGLVAADHHLLQDSLLAQWTGRTCVDRVLAAHPAVHVALRSVPCLLPDKTVLLCDRDAPLPPAPDPASLTRMAERIRAAMTDAWTARQSQRVHPVSLCHGWAWVRSSGATLSADAEKWDKCDGAELVKSDKTVVHRVQTPEGLFYTKRFLADRLYLRRLGLRPPAALQNFRVAFQAHLRGAPVVPHIAAWWGPGDKGRRESLLITGTIPDAVTVKHWIDAHPANPEESRRLIRCMAIWLAHLHGAGIACHDLKLSNILVHQPPAGTPVFTLLDLDNCRLRPFGVTGHDAQRNFHQLFRSTKHRFTSADVLRFLGTYRQQRHLAHRPFRQLIETTRRRILRHGD